MSRSTLLAVLLWAVGQSGCAPRVDRAALQAPKSTESPGLQTASNSGIWAQLRQVDRFTVVLMRHALAPGSGDPANFRIEDCATQRNLSAQGRAQAKQIGHRFRQHQVPVARVLSSQWCRCLETARLLNLGEVEPLPALNSFFGRPEIAAQQTEALRQFMLKHNSEQQVFVMVTHQVNITAIAGTIPEQGEAIVLQLDDQNRFDVVGQLDSRSKVSLRATD